MVIRVHHRSNSTEMRILQGLTLALLVAAPLLLPAVALAQGTAEGEIENRAAPVARRHCIGGTSVCDL